MQIFYSDHYTLPLPGDHRFPMSKYRLLRDYLLDHQIVQANELFESPMATEEMLTLAHTPDYVAAVKKW